MTITTIIMIIIIIIMAPLLRITARERNCDALRVKTHLNLVELAAARGPIKSRGRRFFVGLFQDAVVSGATSRPPGVLHPHRGSTAAADLAELH